MEQTNYKISAIVEEFLKEKDFKKKNDVLVFLMKLRESLEFNATVNWPTVFKELGEVYKDFSPFYQIEEYTPDPIEHTLGSNDIFVFGSNDEGKHYGGAAKFAVDKCGAIIGQARGLQGTSYAIVTLSFNEKTPVSLIDIEKEINEFLEFAAQNPTKKFWMTKIGCGISGFKIEEVAPLFANKVIPSNVILPAQFANSMYLMPYLYSEAKNRFYKLGEKILTTVDPDGPSINTLEDMNIRIYLPKDCQVCTKDDYETSMSYTIDKIQKL